jgi:beta-glucosidase
MVQSGSGLSQNQKPRLQYATKSLNICRGIMAQATFHFPRGFLWGTATSSHQVEGNNTNNTWWDWEQQNGKILQGHKSGLACDWWGGRWRDDFDRAAETEQNAHRMSVEWSRIQPAPDRWDEEALDRYLEMLRGLQERNITPLVTLHHFSDPIWFSETGGWEDEKAVERFELYVRKTASALKDHVTYWCTINEPNLFAVFNYLLGIFPAGKKDLNATMRVFANLVRAHAAAYHAIHEIQPNARVGSAFNIRPLAPGMSWSPLDHLLANLQGSTFNEAIPRAMMDGILRTPLGRVKIPQARNTQDYFGLNYYTREFISFDFRYAGQLFGRRHFSEKIKASKSGMIANDPPGIFEAIKWARSFNLPIWITENGIDDAEDMLRPAYLAQHIHQVWRAVNFNYPVKGYFHWSLVDNFEWERGWTQRFGLWELDLETQARRRRPSADLYTEICKENGLSADMVARYVPQIFAEMFPN